MLWSFAAVEFFGIVYPLKAANRPPFKLRFGSFDFGRFGSFGRNWNSAVSNAQLEPIV
jgi:hypothetical protein